MKKSLIIIIPAVIAILLAFIAYPAQTHLYKSSSGTVSFFSKAPLEDIDATSKNMASVINTSDNEIVFRVAVNTFRFDKAKMETDFNENFMESDKYPLATFEGNIQEKIDWKKEGTYKITAKGTLTVHGVARERVDSGMLIIKNGTVSLTSNLKVSVADHGIKIPRLLYQNIAETVDVKLDVNYLPEAMDKISI